MTSEATYSFDARPFALTWLTVASAAAEDPERPHLYRAVNIELDTDGVRLTSTDSYRFWCQWVGEYSTAKEPNFKKKRSEDVTVSDVDFRARDLMKYILRITAKEDDAPALTLQLSFGKAPKEEGQFEGLESDAALFSLVDRGTLALHESLLIKLTDGALAFPDIRSIFNRHVPQSTERVAFNPEFLSKMTKAVPGSVDRPCTFIFQGDRGPTIIVPHRLNEGWELRGMLMPVLSKEPTADPVTGEIRS